MKKNKIPFQLQISLCKFMEFYKILFIFLGLTGIKFTIRPYPYYSLVIKETLINMQITLICIILYMQIR